MTKELTLEAQQYIEAQGILPRDIGKSDVKRPGIGYNLTLMVTSNGKQILCTNNEDIAIILKGDKLEMRNFNKHVKRALKLDSKGPVLVKVTKNKKGMDGIKYLDRFVPFNALRGHVNFTVMGLAEIPYPRQRREAFAI